MKNSKKFTVYFCAGAAAYFIARCPGPHVAGAAIAAAGYFTAAAAVLTINLLKKG